MDAAASSPACAPSPRGTCRPVWGLGDCQREAATRSRADAAEDGAQEPSATFTWSPSCSLSRLSPARRSPAEMPDRMVTLVWVFWFCVLLCFLFLFSLLL